MHKKALEYLACPHCQGDFELQESVEESNRIKEGELFCSSCQASFKIHHFIPRFVDDQEYVASFGEEWHLFKHVKNTRPLMSKDEMHHYMGLIKEDIEGKEVLEIGCGAGPYLDISAREFHAEHIIGVDLSRAVDAAYENVGQLENVTIIQANLFTLPLRKKSFDVVYSLGVLHHTPDTHEAFQAIAPFVKPKGLMSVWLYGAYWLKKSVNQDRIRKLFTSKMSPMALYRFSIIASWLYYLYKIPFIGHAFRETFPIAMDKDRHVRALNTYDLYSPTYINRHYVDEVYRWFSEEGFEAIEPCHYLLGMKGCKRA